MTEEITLPIILENDNAGRQANHWGKAARRKKQYVETIAILHPGRKPFDHPVELTVTRVIGKHGRKIDADSIGRGSAKELIDALVTCGFLVDDGPKYVTAVAYRQEVDRDNGPAVRIAFDVDEDGPRIDAEPVEPIESQRAASVR